MNVGDLLARLATFLLGVPEEINGARRCPTYLYRWQVGPRVLGCRLYVHRFVADDWSFDLHDHPKRFVSLGLRGSYVEEAPDGSRTRYAAPWLRSFPATHRHRLVLDGGQCWTLVLVLRTTREWGFWSGGKFVHWKAYVFGASKHLADERRTCG